MNSIMNRTSVRQFQDKAVEQEKVELILKAAMQAPSAGNQMPWEFYVITNHEIMTQLSQTSPYASPAANAPLLIVPVTRKEGLRFSSYADIDMAIACENILLEVQELGLGAVWLGIAPLEERVEACNAFLQLPESLTTYALIPVGYPLKDTKALSRYDESRIHMIP